MARRKIIRYTPQDLERMALGVATGAQRKLLEDLLKAGWKVTGTDAKDGCDSLIWVRMPDFQGQSRSGCAMPNGTFNREKRVPYPTTKTPQVVSV